MGDTGECTGLRWDAVECGISRVVGETEDELINDAMDGDNTDRLGGNWSWDMEGVSIILIGLLLFFLTVITAVLLL